MQLLFQEFFRKIFKISEESNFFLIRFLVRFIFYFFIAAFLILIIWSVYSKKYIIVILVLAIMLLGEIAHYIRKSREKIMVEKVVRGRIQKKIIREEKEAKEKSLNKNLLNLKKS